MPRDNDKFVWQTRLFVVMRRVCTRVIDLEYFRTNTAYAMSILQLAEDSNDADLLEISARLRMLMNLPGGRRAAPEPTAPAVSPPPPAAAPAAPAARPVEAVRAAAPELDMQAIIAQVAQQVASQMAAQQGQAANGDTPAEQPSRYIGSLR